MTSHQREQQVQSVESGPISPVNGAMCESASESVPVSVAAGTLFGKRFSGNPGPQTLWCSHRMGIDSADEDKRQVRGWKPHLLASLEYDAAELGQ